MSSTFTWLDYSERERRLMLDVISQFREQDTRDELGLGSVRDAFADLFFPGTSTIQTRARYFFFIPWLYQNIERRRLAPDDIARRARTDEIKLIDALLNSDDQAGVIGKEARKNLQRLPSNIYWQGLGTWGIRSFTGSQAQYHRWLPTYWSLAERPQRNDDGEPISDSLRTNWHTGLPAAPTDFPTVADFKLTSAEAEYLQERILTQAPRTLLAWLVDHGHQTAPINFAWQHPQWAEFPDRIRTQLDHARNFSEVIYGASLLYNLMLAELTKRDDWIEDYRVALTDWAALIQDREAALVHWAADLAQFWDAIASIPVRVTLLTRRFIERWLALALASGAVARLPDSTDTRQLVREREMQLKHGLARLENQRARDLWTGAAGITPIDYRWRVAQVLLTDILNGLKR